PRRAARRRGSRGRARGEPSRPAPTPRRGDATPPAPRRERTLARYSWRIAMRQPSSPRVSTTRRRDPSWAAYSTWAHAASAARGGRRPGVGARAGPRRARTIPAGARRATGHAAPGVASRRVTEFPLTAWRYHVDLSVEGFDRQNLVDALEGEELGLFDHMPRA